MLFNTPRDFSPNDIESMQVLRDGTVVTILNDSQTVAVAQGQRVNQDLDFSGGTESSTYNVSLDYFKRGDTFVGQGPAIPRKKYFT